MKNRQTPTRLAKLSASALFAWAAFNGLSFAAISVVDNSTLSTVFTGTTTAISSSFTVTGGNTLIVELADRSSAAVASNDPATITWGGLTLQLITEQMSPLFSTAGVHRDVAIYYAYNPTAGTNNISFSLPSGGTKSWEVTAFTLSNVDTTIAPVGAASDSAGALPSNLTINNVIAGSYAAADFIWGSSTGSPTVSITGTGGTSTLITNTAGPGASNSLGMGYIANLSAGSDIFSATRSGASTATADPFAVAVFAPITALLWAGGTSTDWGTAGNWSPNSVPGAGANPSFGNASANPTVDLGSSNRTLAGMAFLASVGTTITSASAHTLTLDNGASPVAVRVDGNTHAVNVPVVLNSNIAFTVNTFGNVGTLTMGGVISDGLPGKTLSKAGNGTLVLSAANTYTGLTTVSAGSLKLGVNNALPTGGTVTLQNPGTLDLNGRNQTLAVLNGNGTVTNTAAATTGTLTVGTGSVSTPFGLATVAGTIANGAGTLAVVQNTAGTFSLKNASTYSGGTTVTGTLSIGNNSALGTGGVALAGGSTLSFDVGNAGLSMGLLAGAFNTTGTNPNTYLVNTTTLAGVTTAQGTFPAALPDNSTVVYTGFIRNNGAAGNWTFAENFDDSVLLTVNGQVLLNDQTYNNPTLGTVFMNAGLNTFEVRLGQGGGGVGPVNAGWFTNGTLGLAVDTTGAGAQVMANYSALPVDNGSGNAYVTGGASQITNTVTLNGNATINVGYSAGASTNIQMASVAMGSGRTLSLTAAGANTTITATATSFATTAGFNVPAGIVYNTGAIDAGGLTGTITKTGNGVLRAAAPATSLVAGSVVNVTAGTLALGGDGLLVDSAPIGAASVTLAAGTTLRLDGHGGGNGLLGKYYSITPTNTNNSNPNFNDLTTLTNHLAGLTPTVTTPTITGGKLDFDFTNDGYGNGAPFTGAGATHGNYGFTNVDNMEVTWTGYINITTPGVTHFSSTSDDGTMVFIDGATVVNNNGYHGAVTATGDVTLTAGYHQIILGFYEGGGGAGALFQWNQAGGTLHNLLNTEVINTLSPGPTQSYANNVTVTGDNANIVVNNSPTASIGALALGAGVTTLNVTSTDTSAATYKVSAASTSVAGNVIFNVTNGTTGGVTFVPGAITESAASSVTKNGNGTLVLDQAGNYTGGTTINVGSLVVLNTTGSATGSGPVTVQSTGSLSGTGSMSGNLSVLGGTLSPGNGGVGTISVGGTGVINGAATLNYDLAALNASDKAVFTGTLTVSGSPTLNLNELAGFDMGNYVLATGSSVTNTATFTINQNGGPGTLPGISSNVSVVGGNQLVLAFSNQSLVWTGATDGTWDSATPNWSAVNPFVDGYNVLFDDSSAVTNVSVSGTVQPFKATFNNSIAETYTINGVIGGPGRLVKTNNGTLILAGTNTYTGTTSILGGAVSISDDSNLGAAPVTATAGQLVINGGELLTTVDLTLNANRGIAVGSSVGKFDVTSGTTAIYGGVIANVPAQTGVLTKIGNGTLSLTGASTFTGGTNVNAGVLRLDAPDGTNVLASGSVLNINTGASVEVNHSNLINDSLQVTVVGGTLSFTGGNYNRLNGSLVLDGGTVSSTFGATAYDGQGNYAIETGTVTVTGATTGLSSTIAASIGVHLNGSPNFVVADATNNADPDLTVSASLRNQDGNMNGARGYTKSGPGTMVVTGTNTYTGTTTVSNGLLQVGDGGGTGTLGSGPVVNNSAILINRVDTLVVSGNVSGTGTLTKDGSGNTILSGDNSAFSGGITVLNGTVTATGNATALGAGLVTLNGGTLALGAVGFTGFANFTANGGAVVSNQQLMLTDGVNGEARSSFTNTRKTITNAAGFAASFLYTPAGNKAADGVTFTIQNAPAGAAALGGGGGAMAYQGIGLSAAVSLNIFTGAAGGIGTNVVTNGANPGGTANQSVAPVNLAGGNPIRVDLVYDGTAHTITEILTDTVNGLSNSSTPLVFSGVNLETLLGGQLGYVGFTGATGGSNAIQTIRDFTFDNQPGVFNNNILVTASSTAEVNVVPKASGGAGQATAKNLTVQANASLNITGGSLSLDSLSIGNGATVTFGGGPEAAPVGDGSVIVVVPEPGSIGLLLAGAVGLVSRRRRTR